jgi:uncharacterized protein (DUF3084 family)
MKHVALALAALAVIVAAYSATAWSAAPPTPTEKRLLKDVKSLQAKVKTLQADVKQLKTRASDVEEAAGIAIVVSACNTAIAADALQGTWQVIDQLSSATQAGKTYFGAQTPVVDTVAGRPICQTIGVNRSQVLPPTSAQHSALLALLR